MKLKQAWRRKGERGSVLVEAAISIVLLVTLMTGAVEACQLLYDDLWISNLARAATRYAMVRGSASGRAVAASDITTYVQAHAGGLKTANLTATTTWAPNNSPGSTVTIKLQYTFHGYVPFVPVTTVALQSTSQMVISQ
jgi:Flp pilus assembly protein TadG